MEVEALRLGWAVYQLSSQKSCVRSRALQTVQSWRKGSSERSICLSPKFVFKTFFFFFQDDIFSVLGVYGNHNLEMFGFPLHKVQKSSCISIFFDWICLAFRDGKSSVS